MCTSECKSGDFANFFLIREDKFLLCLLAASIFVHCLQLVRFPFSSSNCYFFWVGLYCQLFSPNKQHTYGVDFTFFVHILLCAQEYKRENKVRKRNKWWIFKFFRQMVEYILLKNNMEENHEKMMYFLK